MRHFIAILMLVFSAWVFQARVAEAHGMPHDMPASGICPDCSAMAGSADVDQVEGHTCHHGSGCFAYGLPVAMSTIVPGSEMSEGHRPERQVTPRSAMLARDLPPPRS